jgi:hypothetical protein
MVMKGWLVDLAVGGLVGGLVGAIAAVNFIIWTGIEQGYEASLVEVFQLSLIASIVTVMILIAGPMVGVVTARRLRRTRGRGSHGDTDDQRASTGHQ